MPDLKFPSINKVTISARLTRDPEMKHTASGHSICSMGLASSRKYNTASGEPREETLFINCKVWAKSGEWCAEHLKKGYPVYVEARLCMNEWTTAEGETKRIIELNADNVQALTWENTNGNNLAGGGERPVAAIRQTNEPEGGDDLPF